MCDVLFQMKGQRGQCRKNWSIAQMAASEPVHLRALLRKPAAPFYEENEGTSNASISYARSNRRLTLRQKSLRESRLAIMSVRVGI